jgi:hypothetical protein
VVEGHGRVVARLGAYSVRNLREKDRGTHFTATCNDAALCSRAYCLRAREKDKRVFGGGYIIAVTCPFSH